MTALLEQSEAVTNAPADHVAERAGDRAAVVSDLGRRHARNEDAGTVAVDGAWAALVVCDGVGSSPRSERAALAASRASRDALRRSRSRGASLATQVRDGVQDAARAAAGSRGTGEVRAPACTLAAAVTDGVSVAAVSVGDSRVYWIPDTAGRAVPGAGTDAARLTEDDSYAAASVAMGLEPNAVARGPFAHVITRWLGADAPALGPDIIVGRLSGPGWLLACTDGFWNHLPVTGDASAVAALVESIGAADPMQLSEELVAWANGQGGHDNICVALARVG